MHIAIRSASLAAVVIWAYLTDAPAAAISAKLYPTLNDILSAHTIDGLRVSSDGSKIAFRTSSSDIEGDHTTVQWYATPITGNTKPTALGRALEPVWLPAFSILDDPVAEWMPDDKNLAVLAIHDSSIQIHVVGENGFQTLLTNDAADIDNFSINRASGTLRYATGNARSAIDAAQDRENRSGIHLTGSVNTEGYRLTGNYRIGSRQATMRHLTGATPTENFVGPLRTREIDLRQTRFVNIASPLYLSDRSIETADFEATAQDALGLPALPDGVHFEARRLDGIDKVLNVAKWQIDAVDQNGDRKPCPAEFCQGSYPSLRQAMSSPSTGEVVVLADLKHFGHPSLYGWNPRSGRARLIWEGRGSLSTGSNKGQDTCPLAGNILICVLSSATRPPELVAIDITSGSEHVLADPNVDLASRAFPLTRPMEWQTPFGPVTGVLVLPYQTSGPAPLVITSYGCSGFLQGGTAEVTPEFILAQHGIASVCLNMIGPGVVETLRKDQMEPVEVHREVLEILKIVTDDLIARKIADAARLGISGQSFSSVAAAFAISHGDIFRAASIGTGITIDPIAYYLAAPVPNSWRKDTFSILGLPPPDNDPKGVWQQASPALNARRILAPLLIQSPENEYLFALQLYASIADSGGAVDMYVFPNTGHGLAEHPAQQFHRAARSIAWFRFWLRGEQKQPGYSSDELLDWAKLAARRGGDSVGSARP